MPRLLAAGCAAAVSLRRMEDIAYEGYSIFSDKIDLLCRFLMVSEGFIKLSLENGVPFDNFRHRQAFLTHGAKDSEIRKGSDAEDPFFF